jgi:predicted Fe-Mo cluster-binding NifX family protein
MKIAIPVWDKGISPVFDTASRLLVVEIEDRKETSRFEIYLDEQDVSRRCIRIRNLGIDVLICGAISRPYSSMLMSSGINVISELSGQAGDVLDAYLRGNLFNSPRFQMPGCKKSRT